MALDTFANLKSSIASWLARSDLTTNIPDLITIAESQFNRDIRHRRMITTGTLTTVAQTATVALPSDYLEARALLLQTDPVVNLSFVTSSQLATNWPNASGYGQPSEYTVIGSNVKLGRVPDAVYNIELEYYQKIPALSDSNTTNWLLTNYPDVYLWGSLLAAAPFIKDDERIPMWGSFLQRAIEGLGQESDRSLWSAGPLSTRVSVTVA